MEGEGLFERGVGLSGQDGEVEVWVVLEGGEGEGGELGEGLFGG